MPRESGCNIHGKRGASADQPLAADLRDEIILLTKRNRAVAAIVPLLPTRSPNFGMQLTACGRG